MSIRSRANLLPESTLTHLEEGKTATASNTGGIANHTSCTYEGSSVLPNRATNNRQTSPTLNRYGTIQDHFTSSMNQSDKHAKKTVSTCIILI